MAWIAFVFLLVVIAVVLVLLIYSAFSGRGAPWMNVALVLLDGLFGWCLKWIISYLFPPLCREKDGTVRLKS
jgi:hypothetical protein